MEKSFTELREKVFQRQPVLRQISQENGEKLLFDYVQNWKTCPASPNGLFEKVFNELASKFYGPEIARQAGIQLRENLLVSTIDHHGILNHPFFVNSNAIYGLYKNQKYLICLSTAGVSLNNNSSWSGCFLFHNRENILQRVSLFTEKDKTHSVFAKKPFSRHRFPQILDRTDEGMLRETLADLLEICSAEEIVNQNLFMDQATLLAPRLWKRIFPHAPQVLYFPIELIVNSLLVELLNSGDTLFSTLLCSEEGWDLLEKYFQGQAGAFTSPHKGSFLFWGIENFRRVHLSRQGNKLTGDNFTIQLTKNQLIESIMSGKIYPTSSLCFLVLLYSGVTCLGGFNQVNWLTEIQRRFILLLKEFGMNELAQKIMTIPTKNFAESSLILEVHKNTLVQLSGVDIAALPERTYEKYVQLAKTITLAESLDFQMPEIYKVVFSAAEQDKVLLSAANKELFSSQNIQDKLR